MEYSENCSESGRKRPALTPEERQRRCEMLAYNLAEKKLEDGTASNQIIVHFLKLATEQTKLEEMKLEADVELSRAKIDAMASQQREEEKTAQVLAALRRYQGTMSYDD